MRRALLIGAAAGAIGSGLSWLVMEIAQPTRALVSALIVLVMGAVTGFVTFVMLFGWRSSPVQDQPPSTDDLAVALWRTATRLPSDEWRSLRPEEMDYWRALAAVALRWRPEHAKDQAGL